jgi:multidrug resistance efflux pump
MAGFVAGKAEPVDLQALEAARLAVEQAENNSDALEAAIGELDALVEAALAQMWT